MVQNVSVENGCSCYSNQIPTFQCWLVTNKTFELIFLLIRRFLTLLKDWVPYIQTNHFSIYQTTGEFMFCQISSNLTFHFLFISFLIILAIVFVWYPNTDVCWTIHLVCWYNLLTYYVNCSEVVLNKSKWRFALFIKISCIISQSRDAIMDIFFPKTNYKSRPIARSHCCAVCNIILDCGVTRRDIIWFQIRLQDNLVVVAHRMSCSK